MEDYSHQLSENTRGSSSFLYATSSVPEPNSSSSLYERTNNNNHQTHLPISLFHLQPGDFFQSDQAHPIVKTEPSSTSQHGQVFHYPLIRGGGGQVTVQQHHQQQELGGNDIEAIKAKIISHPQYSNVLEAYMDCQKVGAPSEVVDRLTTVYQEFESRQRSSATCSRDASEDPELDQFMEAYYNMLLKYREELTRPLQEAMEFLRRIETQLNLLSHGSEAIFSFDEKGEGVDSSEEEQENNGEEIEVLPEEIDPRVEDRELKNHLRKKYSGYLSSLKQELSKKRKKGKLPKDARQKLLNWWELHYKWPYPSETEKTGLAEATGLDPKQINNWFINQRKRHWKPSEDMQFMVMDGMHPQTAALYMDGHFMADASYRLGP